MSLAMKTCFFTGHRKIRIKDIQAIKKLLKNEILSAIYDGTTTFISGGALGFDTIAAEQVIALKEEYPIRLHLYLPCRKHQMRWSEGDKLRFDNIEAMADEVRYISDEEYTKGCMRDRNLAMVEASDMCIAYMKNLYSGTAQTVNMAEIKGIKIVNIANL